MRLIIKMSCKYKNLYTVPQQLFDNTGCKAGEANES